MKPQEVKDFFKTGYKFGKLTKMSPNTLANWIKFGYVPCVAQKKIEQLTKGALTADWDWQQVECKNAHD